MRAEECCPGLGAAEPREFAEWSLCRAGAPSGVASTSEAPAAPAASGASRGDEWPSLASRGEARGEASSSVGRSSGVESSGIFIADFRELGRPTEAPEACEKLEKLEREGGPISSASSGVTNVTLCLRSPSSGGERWALLSEARTDATEMLVPRPELELSVVYREMDVPRPELSAVSWLSDLRAGAPWPSSRAPTGPSIGESSASLCATSPLLPPLPLPLSICAPPLASMLDPSPRSPPPRGVNSTAETSTVSDGV